MKIAEFTALLFLLTQFTIPANATPGWPTLPCSIFHAALLLLHASRDAAATSGMLRRNKAAAQAEIQGQEQGKPCSSLSSTHVVLAAVQLSWRPQLFALAQDKQIIELPTTKLAISRAQC